MRDLRDPKPLGEALIDFAGQARQAYNPKIPLSEVWDVHGQHISFPNYNANPTCIEKYGRPQDLPETPF